MASDEFVHGQSAPGGAVAGVLTIVAVITLVGAGLALVAGGGFGFLVALYIALGGFSLLGFASIVGNLEKIVWILQRTALPANATVTSHEMSSGGKVGPNELNTPEVSD